MTGEPELVEVAQKACAEMGRWREGAWLGDSGRKACWAERGPSSPSRASPNPSCWSLAGADLTRHSQRYV